MAKMWPQRLPQDIVSNPLRKSECRVYESLQNILDDSFVVFYSRPWLGLTPYGEERDGECDFLIAHPDRGILALEIKGGGVAYDPAKDKWTSRDRWNIVHTIKNPVQQAMTCKHQILSKLNRSKLWRSRFIRARHGVIFPDSEKPDEDTGVELPLEICCFLDEFENDLGNWVMKRFGDFDNNSSRVKPMGEDGIKALEALLAHPFHLHVPMSKILADDERKIKTLTQQQYHILETIQEIPRAVISGGAGTGKTILAMEEAIRRADSGMRVLLTCYNKPLSEELSINLESWNNITVTTFHGLCAKCASKANIVIPESLSTSELFNETYPEILSEALEKLPDQRYDAIIIDEGQDFILPWIRSLDKALDEDGNKLLRIFVDSNQSVYTNITSIPTNSHMVPLRLTKNMRNTKNIHSVVQDYYKGYPINPIGPEGIAVEWIPADSIQTIKQKINDKIYHLLSEERLEPADIAVMAIDQKSLKLIAPSGVLGGELCQSADMIEDEVLVLDTIRRFKGLERKVVILAATPDLIGNRELIYVALSRARTHLIIIGHTEDLKKSAVN